MPPDSHRLPRTVVLAALVLSALATPPAVASSRPPNVLLVIADDMGWGDVRAHGNDKVDTPVLDRLAAQGARFDRFFVSPVCAPTRASLLTGRYHLRTGTHGVTRGWETMRSAEVTLAEVLKRAGYATGIFGKWHNGAHYPNHPNGQGFDEFVGFCAGHWNNYFDTTLEHNGRPLPTKGFITDVLTDHALRFIERHHDRPFFCYLPYNAPHSPFQVPDRYFDKYRARGFAEKEASVHGMVENIDDNLGRVLARLDQLKLTENTVVIFLTDNGPNTDRFNGGMRGRKGSVHEGGIRVPCFVRWPGHVRPGTTIVQVAGHIDVLPTLVELAGLERPQTLPLDGVSLAPLLRGTAKAWPDRRIFTHQAGAGTLTEANGSVRTQRWRLVHPKKSGWELYDMEADPGQQADVAKRHPEVVAELKKAYLDWFRDVTREPLERPWIPVGHPQAKVVELPAPEAFLSGGVAFKGKNGFANDWVTDWRKTDDEVAWQLDVANGGTFAVTLLYTCPAADVGAKVRVGIGGQTLDAVVSKAHDPQPLPSPDRFPRGEVYEKVWGELPAGRVALKPGRTRLTLRATEIPGDRVMELKGVRLRQVK